MDKNEILERLERLARCAIHTVGELPYVMSLDDGIAIHEAIDMLRSQPEPHWIPWNSGTFPEESGTYTVTVYDGATKRVTYAKYQKRLKRWELTGARAYWQVLAWMPLPEAYREGES